jgi:protein SCO1/2
MLACAACRKEESAFEPIQPLDATPSLAPQKYWTVPDFTLTDQNGQPFGLSNLKGKVWVADFFYATCPGPCPMLTARLAQVEKDVSDIPDFHLVSITVDPESDTPEVLKTYAERFKGGANWSFCTGEKDTIYKLIHDGFKLPLTGANPQAAIIHTTRVALVDKMGTVRGFYEGGTDAGAKELVQAIRNLAQEK